MIKTIIAIQDDISEYFIKIFNIIPQSERKIIRDAEKFWSSSKNNSDRQDLSHWRGKGRWMDDFQWLAIGEQHLSLFKELCEISNTSIQTMVEWGPGGGSNLLAFKNQMKIIYGVDISPSNLDECENQLIQAGYTGFKKVLISVDSPEDCIISIDSAVDFFLSTAVYQHFPSKEYGIEVTKIAYNLLSEKGVALIQTRYEDGNNRVFSKKRNYFKNAIGFTSYTIEEFWKISEIIGFKPVAIYLKPESNYAYYFLKKGDT